MYTEKKIMKIMMKDEEERKKSVSGGAIDRYVRM